MLSTPPPLQPPSFLRSKALADLDKRGWQEKRTCKTQQRRLQSIMRKRAHRAQHHRQHHAKHHAQHHARHHAQYHAQHAQLRRKHQPQHHAQGRFTRSIISQHRAQENLAGRTAKHDAKLARHNLQNQRLSRGIDVLLLIRSGRCLI